MDQRKKSLNIHETENLMAQTCFRFSHTKVKFLSAAIVERAVGQLIWSSHTMSCIYPQLGTSIKWTEDESCMCWPLYGRMYHIHLSPCYGESFVVINPFLCSYYVYMVFWFWSFVVGAKRCCWSLLIRLVKSQWAYFTKRRDDEHISGRGGPMLKKGWRMIAWPWI